MDTARLRRLVPALAALFLLYAACAAIVSSGLLAAAPETMAAAVAIDLTVTAAALVYVLAVRPGLLPRSSLVVVVWAGIALAAVLLPDGQVKARALPFAFVAMEATLAVLALRSPRLRAIFRGELEALAYGLGGWFRRARPARHSFLRGRPWGAVVGAFVFLVAVETLVLHVLLVTWSPVAAWIATAASLYGLVWVAGDYHALRLHAPELGAEALSFRFGLRWRVRVPWELVADAVATEAAVPEARDALRCSLLRTDVLLTLREPVVVEGPFGFTRRVTRIALAVSDPLSFVADVRGHSRAIR